MMSNDLQKLHDAVLLLGDAALEIATALSAFTKGGEDSVAFRRPGDPKPWPKTGEPLTAERFAKLVDPPALEPTIAGTGTGFVESAVELSYVTGKVLSAGSSERRRAARKNAKKRGFDLEHWSKMVRSVRTEKLKIGRPELAAMLQVSTDSINQWEAGVCFATSDHRQVLEVIAHSMSGVGVDAWRKPA